MGIGQDRMEAECQVALNAPSLAQSVNVIKAAHSLHWSKAKRKGKYMVIFLKKSCDVILFKLVDRLCDKKPNLPFIM